MAKETADDFFAISNFARVEKTDFCAVPTEWPTNHLIFGLHECQMQKKKMRAYSLPKVSIAMFLCREFS